jgi:hypothetical protein
VKSPGFIAGEAPLPTGTTEKRHRYFEPPGNVTLPNNLKHFNCPSNWSHLMLFADGAVRSISKEIDPKLLKSLITINGKKDVSEFFRNQ